MAYVFGFGKDVTRLMYSMRDWKLEDVKRDGGTPSCLALRPYEIRNDGAKDSPPDLGISTYWIEVKTRIWPNYIHWILALYDNKFGKFCQHEWANGVCRDNQEFAKKHGAHVYPCPINDWPLHYFLTIQTKDSMMTMKRIQTIYMVTTVSFFRRIGESGELLITR